MTSPQRALRDANRAVTLLAASADGSQVPIQLEADPITNRLYVTATVSGTVSADNLGSSPRTGQATATGSPVALGTSQPLKNGLIVQALSTNASSVFVGGSSVTSATGFELQAGQATSVAISDPSLVYLTGTGSACWISSY